MTIDSLAGMHFIDDEGETYSTGHIISRIEPGVYLVRYDGRLNELPMELVSMDEILGKRWDLFPSREAMDEWIALLDGEPDGPKVLTFVKK